MEILAALRMSMRLLIGTGLALFIAEVTALMLFSWIAIGMSIWLFMSLYWLTICCIGYWYERESKPDTEAPEQPSDWMCQCQLSQDDKCHYHWLKECTEPHYHMEEEQLWN